MVERAQADAVEDAAGDTAQHGVMDQVHLAQGGERVEPEGQGYGAEDPAEKIVAAHQPVGQENKGMLKTMLVTLTCQPNR